MGGATAAWPLAARAQQPAMPVIGILYVGTQEQSTYLLTSFRKGLSDAGYVEGRNVAVEYCFAQNETDRLPELAADLVRRRVAVIAAIDTPSALVAKTMTTTVPIVFETAGDPVQAGLVSSLNRPGGNITGATSMNTELMPKRLGILHELLPKATRFALLINPSNRLIAAPVIPDLERAAAAIGRQIEVVAASTNREIDAAFESAVQMRVDALLVSPDNLFNNRRVQIVTLAAHHRLPAIYYYREYAEAGGLMSYASNIFDVFRQSGIYTGRVLKGEKPADLPVQSATKYQTVINLKTARALGLTIPQSVLARADEVIE
jgi:putative ABC transport system substrate-binding protein